VQQVKAQQLPKQWREQLAERDRRDRAAVRMFVEAVKAADVNRLAEATEALELSTFGTWRKAMREIAKSPCQSDDFRMVLARM
jgi:hypothetical protein